MRRVPPARQPGIPVFPLIFWFFLATKEYPLPGSRTKEHHPRPFRSRMTLEELRQSLNADSPPRGVGELIEALWHEARGDWDRAHSMAQAAGGRNGAWVHAYLHRKEGDLSNAAYWYGKAGRRQPFGSLEAEWEEIVRALL